MRPLTLIFTSKKYNPGSFLIRTWTWSDWSHVAVLDGDHVIEATLFHGVRRVPLSEALKGVTRIEAKRFDGIDGNEVIANMRTQIGKKYDLKAIFGIAFKQVMETKSRWICSELIVWAMAQAGFAIFNEGIHYKVTQEDLFRINSKIFLSRIPDESILPYED